MQKGHVLEFNCLGCSKPVQFSVFDIEETPLECRNCGKKYAFHNETLLQQLRKFEALCLQIRDSEEILGNTSVGIDLGDQQVKVPYKILLSRLNTTLDLQVGDTPLSILFRMEPTHDLPRLTPATQG